MKKPIFIFLMLLMMATAAFAVVNSATPLKDVYSGNDSTTQWPYNFPISATSDIHVYVTDSDGVETEILSNFSVDPTNLWVVYPVTGSALATGNTITLLPRTPQTQTLALGPRSPFVATAIGAALDKNVMLVQQLQEQVNRSVKLPITEDAAPYFPSPQVGYSLVWDASGNFVNSDLTGPAGATGPAGPAGSGAGDVLGPAANNDLYIPQWNGANTKTLKNGLTTGTGALNLVQVGADGKLPALDGSNLTNVPVSISSVPGSALTTLASIPSGAGYIPSANLNAIPDSVLATISTAGKVSGAAITSLTAVPAGAGALPVANGGTGQITASLAINALLPSQTGKGGKFLSTNGTAASWDSIDSVIYTTPGTYSWTAPSGVDMIRVAMVGGGGGGGGNADNQGGGSGGGAGAYVGIGTTTSETFLQVLPVIAGASYNVTVGTAGVGGITNVNGSPGGNTSVAYYGGTFTANTGSGGVKNGGAGGAGGTATTTGTNYLGGDTSSATGGVAGEMLLRTIAGAKGGDSGGATYGGGGGGSGPYGHGGTGATHNGAAATAATGYGAGGGGSADGNFAGANGSGGMVYIEWNR